MIWANEGDFYVQEEKNLIRGGANTGWEAADDTGYAVVSEQAAVNEQADRGCKRDSSQAAEELNITKTGRLSLNWGRRFLF